MMTIGIVGAGLALPEEGAASGAPTFGTASVPAPLMIGTEAGRYQESSPDCDAYSNEYAAELTN
jgi:hypothetical protein